MTKKSRKSLFLLFLMMFFQISTIYAGAADNNPLQALIISGEQTAVFHVSPQGNDDNPGTAVSPFRTIQKAVDIVKAGDTVFVYDGVYHETVRISQAGTADLPITIAAFPGHHPIIDGEYERPPVPNSGWAGCNDTVSPPKCYIYEPLVSIEGDHIILDGFEIRHSLGRGIRVWRDNGRVSHITIQNNTIHDNRNAAIRIIDARDVIFENNQAWHSGNYATHDRSGSPNSDYFEPNIGWPLAVSDTRSQHITYRGNQVFENWTEGIGAGLDSNHITIEDNVLYDNRALQIYIHRAKNVTVQQNLVYCTNNPTFWRGGNPPPGIVINNESQFEDNQITENISVINNIVVGCRQNFAIWGNGGYLVDDVLIAYNTFVNATSNNGQTEAVAVNITNDNKYENVQFTNNLIYQPQFTISSSGGAEGIRFANNLWSRTPSENMIGVGDIVADPQLINPDAPLLPGQIYIHRYKPGSGSPAINRADPRWNILRDFDHYLRFQPDIGAIEVQQAPREIRPL